jgi:hypothetical protein
MVIHVASVPSKLSMNTTKICKSFAQLACNTLGIPAAAEKIAKDPRMDLTLADDSFISQINQIAPYSITTLIKDHCDRYSLLLSLLHHASHITNTYPPMHCASCILYVSNTRHNFLQTLGTPPPPLSPFTH